MRVLRTRLAAPRFFGALIAALLLWPSPVRAAGCEAGDIDCRLEALETEDRSKDFWDKLSASGAVLTGGLVALAGLVVSHRYNEQSAAARRVEVVEKLLPHLASGEADKIEAAILLIDTVDSEAAARLANLFADEGGIAASRRIESSPLNGSAQAGTLLDAFEDQLKTNVVSIKADGVLRGLGLVVGPTSVVTPAWVVESAGETTVVAGATSQSASVERVDESSGAALLALRDPRDSWLDVREVATPVPGRDVYLVSDLRRSAGRIEGREEFLGYSCITMSGLARLGEGGAPVVDGNGRLVGLVVAFQKERSITALIPADAVSTLVSSAAS